MRCPRCSQSFVRFSKHGTGEKWYICDNQACSLASIRETDERLSLPDPLPQLGQPSLKTGDSIRIEREIPNGQPGLYEEVTVTFENRTLDGVGFWDKFGDIYLWGQVIEYL